MTKSEVWKGLASTMLKGKAKNLSRNLKKPTATLRSPGTLTSFFANLSIDDSAVESWIFSMTSLSFLFTVKISSSRSKYTFATVDVYKRQAQGAAIMVQ